MRQLGVSVLIGAALAGGYRATIGQALGGLGQLDQGLAGLQRRLLDIGQAWAGLQGIKHVVGAAGDLEHELTQIGITADMTGDQVEQLRVQLRALSVGRETNQSVTDLGKAYKALVSSGLENDKASAALRAIGRTATAATADIEDVAKMSFTLIDTLGIAPDALASELDRLAFAGKKGSFELKDMARFFPTLGAAAKEAGLTGTEGVAALGAALQIARKGAGESGEAANNMKNFFQKMMSPETMKNMAAHGVNVTKLMSDALKNGENPVEVYLQRLDKMLGDDPVKRKARLGSLMGDMQVQDFIRPMLSRMDQYKQLKAEILTAAGTVDQDYGRILGTFKEQARGAGNALDNLGASIGKSLLPPLGAVIGFATPVISWMSGVVETAPGTTAAITGVGAAMMILPPALRLVAFGFRAVGTAVAANPIGAAVMVLATAAGLIYDHWQPIKSFFEGIWDGAKAKWGEFAGYVGEIWAKISAPVEKALAFAGITIGNKGGASPAPSAGAVLARAQSADARGGEAAASGVAAAGSPGADGKVLVEVSIPNLPRGGGASVTSSGSGVAGVDLTTGFQMAF